MIPKFRRERHDSHLQIQGKHGVHYEFWVSQGYMQDSLLQKKMRRQQKQTPHKEERETQRESASEHKRRNMNA